MYIKVRVQAGSPSEQLTRVSDDTFCADVTEPARGGAANARVLTLLRKHFKSAKRLYIVSGHHSPHKIININE